MKKFSVWSETAEVACDTVFDCIVAINELTDKEHAIAVIKETLELEGVEPTERNAYGVYMDEMKRIESEIKHADYFGTNAVEAFNTVVYINR